jgi:hypothetical protein
VVDLGDEVVDLLLRDADGLDVERGAVDDRAGGAAALTATLSMGCWLDDMSCVKSFVLRGGTHTGDAECHVSAILPAACQPRSAGDAGGPTSIAYLDNARHATRFILIQPATPATWAPPPAP